MGATAIEIIKYFRKWLVSDEALTALVDPANIKPLVLPPNRFPFVSLARGEITPDYTKDGLSGDEVRVLAAVVSDDYGRGIEIAAEIRRLLEYKRYEDDDVSIPAIRVESVSEDYASNAFIQSVVFSMRVIPKG